MVLVKFILTYLLSVCVASLSVKLSVIPFKINRNKKFKNYENKLKEYQNKDKLIKITTYSVALFMFILVFQNVFKFLNGPDNLFNNIFPLENNLETTVKLLMSCFITCSIVSLIKEIIVKSNHKEETSFEKYDLKTKQRKYKSKY